MRTNWVGSELLDGRLAPRLYQDELLSALRQAKQRGFSIKEVDAVCERVYDGNHGERHPSVFTESGPVFIKNTHFYSLAITEYDHISDEDYDQLRPGLKGLKFGDVLVAIKGDVGRTAIYLRHETRGTINPAAACCRPLPTTDGRFLAVQFESSYFKKQIVAVAESDSTRPQLSLSDFKPLHVILPRHEIQKAIGDKVRKAEQLRELAQQTLRRMGKEIDDLFGIYKWSKDETSGWLNREHLTTQRLDSWFNQPKYVAFGDHLSRQPRFEQIQQFTSLQSKAVSWKSFRGDSFPYFEIGCVTGQPGEIEATEVKVSERPSRAEYEVTDGDILVSTVRPNLKNIAIVPPTFEWAVCSSGFSVLRCQSKNVAGYVWACLMHELATLQMMRWNTGGTYPAIDRNVVMGVLIPSPGEDEIERIGGAIGQGLQLNRDANQLIEQAKVDLELLLNGELDEEQLIEESNAFASWLDSNSSSIEAREK